MTPPLLALVATARFEGPAEAGRGDGPAGPSGLAGVTVAGAAEPVARLVREVADEPGGGRCAVLGTALTARSLAAARWNGTAAHALDDGHLDPPGHVTAPIHAQPTS